MRCKQCGEGFPKGQSYNIWELKRQEVTPADAQGLTSNFNTEDAGVFCSRDCLTNYLKSGNKSGVFDLGGARRT